MKYLTRARLFTAVAPALFMLSLVAQPATAQTLRPGLWEINNKMGGSAEMDKAMAQMQQQMASMSPEERKMMQGMMAKQGMAMSPGAGGAMAVKICMTPEMAQRNDLPAQQGDCKTTTSPRTGNSMKMSFICTRPPSSGEGTVTFTSPEAYTMKMTTKSTVQGKPETMTMDASGKWLSADCGAIKPMAAPKK